MVTLLELEQIEIKAKKTTWSKYQTKIKAKKT